MTMTESMITVPPAAVLDGARVGDVQGHRPEDQRRAPFFEAAEAEVCS